MKKFFPFILVLSLTTPFWDLGHPLWEVDDARYAEVPREMAESGNWLTPSLNYMDYVEKPPMIYWLGAASYTFFGVSEAAARLPHALLALLGLAGAWWLGAWLYSAETGLAAALILAGCGVYYGLSHNMTPDMAVSVFLLWATALGLRCLKRPLDGTWAGPLAWVAMTGAFLSKGLIACLLPGVWACALLILFPRLRKGLRPLLLNWGTLFFAVVIGSWFALMERANPGFFHVFVIEQHFQRFLTPKYNRPGPWYFFLGVDLAGTLPWAVIAAAGVLVPLMRRRAADSRDLQLALWVALIFAFFSASSSKLLTYILPLFPHQAILAARLLERLGTEESLARVLRPIGTALGALLILAGLAAPFVLGLIPSPFPGTGTLAAAGTAVLILLGAGTAAVSLAGKNHETRETLARAGACALAVQALLIVGTRELTDQLSVKKMAAEISARVSALEPGTEARILSYDSYPHGIAFYTGRPLDLIDWVGEMHYAKRFPKFAHRFGDGSTISALPEPGRRAFVVMKRKVLSRFLTLNPPEDIANLTEFGPWVLAEL